MNYKVTWIEEKRTTTGKVKADATLIDENGQQIEKVTIWADYPNFPNIRPESTIEGAEVVINTVTKNGRTFHNKTLTQIKTNTLNRTPQAQKSPIQVAMADKTKSIAQAQERKSDSIKVASTARDATILTAAYVNTLGMPCSQDEMKTYWTEWRKWLDAQYDVPFN